METIMNKNVFAIETKVISKIATAHANEIVEMGAVTHLTRGFGNSGMEMAGSMFRPWK